MLLTILSALIMFIVAYAYLREGLMTGCCMCINVFLAGLVAFNFWEPLANLLESPLSGSFMKGYEDALCMFVLFIVTLAGLRVVTNLITPSMVQFSQTLQRGGGFVFGLLTGYLVAGFLICLLQTLPWHENFMFFDANSAKGDKLRRFIPPDRVWLSLMYKAGRHAFANSVDERGSKASRGDSPYDKYSTFDRDGTFELRYARYRRYGDRGEPMPYRGEFDNVLPRKR